MTIAYIDANAIIDRFADADGARTAAIVVSLDAHGAAFVTSRLSDVEARRYLHRTSAARVEHDAVAMLEGVTTVPINDTVLAVAGSIEAQHLGALDAIHLATALLVRADVVVTGDRKLARASEALGIPVL